MPEHDLADSSVQMESFRLRPGSNLRVGDGSFQFVPLAQAGAAWDSDPDGPSGPSGGQARLRLGLGGEFRALGRDDWRAEAAVMVRHDAYPDEPSLGFTGGDGRLRLMHAGAASLTAVEGSWLRDAEPVFSNPEAVRREYLAANATHRETRAASSWALALSGDSMRYLQDTPAFSVEERSYQRVSATGRWYALGGGGSHLGAELALADVERPDAILTNGYRAMVLQGSWRHAIGARSSIDLRFGGDLRDFGGPSGDNPGNDDETLLVPEGSLGGRWSWGEESGASLTASCGLDDGQQEGVNASYRQALRFDALAGMSRGYSAYALAWLIRREDSASLTSAAPTVTVDTLLRLGLDRTLSDSLRIAMWADYQHTVSTPAGTATHTTISIELLAAL